MNKILRIVLYVVGGIVVAVACLLGYVRFGLPQVGPPPSITIERTAERIQRGKYLAHHVMVCVDCHSQRDWTKFSGPLVAGTEGRGGEVFDQKVGLPGRYIAPNITPYHLSAWTDGEIFRAITSGVGKDGRPLFPIMPHPNFGQLDENDIHAVIAYVRSLQPIEHRTEDSQSDFPMSLIIRTIPQKAQSQPIPSEQNTVAYGKYLVTAASCSDCHTNYIDGSPVGDPFAGGREFPMPDGSLIQSANITPHATGIGGWTQEEFVRRFTAYADSAQQSRIVQKGEFQTIMPWTMYAGMRKEDLQAIYAYLRTIKPAENRPKLYTSAASKPTALYLKK